VVELVPAKLISVLSTISLIPPAVLAAEISPLGTELAELYSPPSLSWLSCSNWLL